MRFRGPYGFLSNLYMLDKPITYEELTGYSVEALYHASKFTNPEIRKKIASMDSVTSKKENVKYKAREDFDNDRLPIMDMLIDRKFLRAPMCYLLLSLKNTNIVEENYHGDVFWGTYRGKGKNHLGNIITSKQYKLENTLRLKRRLKRGNLYRNMEGYDFVVFTSNSTLNSKKELVMGKGTAKVIKTMYPDLPKYFGRIMEENEYNMLFSLEHKIITLQTKFHFKNNSPFELVKRSVQKLIKYAEDNPHLKIATPIPGVNNGNLDYMEVLSLFIDKPNNLDIWDDRDDIFGIIFKVKEDRKLINRAKVIVSLLKRKRVRYGGNQGPEEDIPNVTRNHTSFVPWYDYYHNTANKSKTHQSYSVEGFKLATLLHKGWSYLSNPSKKIIVRNYKILLGSSLDRPCDYLIYCSEDNNKSLETIVNSAKMFGIKTYNIKNDNDFKKIKKILIGA